MTKPIEELRATMSPEARALAESKAKELSKETWVTISTRIVPYSEDPAKCSFKCQHLHNVAAFCKLFVVGVGDVERRDLVRCQECLDAENDERKRSCITMGERIQRAFETEDLIVVDKDYFEHLKESRGNHD